MTSASRSCDAVVIGGGPAGSCTASLLASWGHDVMLLTRPPAGKGRAESLPPSARKLLAEIGVLEQVELGGFPATTGNTVWWGDREGHAEPFGGSEAAGFQVFRPHFDRVLLDHAIACGATVLPHAAVARWALDGAGDARVDYDHRGTRASVRARLLIDCSGRAGVMARQGRRRYDPAFRSQALLGAWRQDAGWRLADDTHTTVETFDEGWAWSLPVSREVRHVGLMVDAATGARAQRSEGLERAYRDELARARRHGALVAGASLLEVWASDASMYDAETYAGAGFLLVGDAACAIDPLSSFGVKKALAAAWVGAVTAQTIGRHPERQRLCQDFYNSWSRDVYATALGQSRAFAREALTRHRHAFWMARAADTSTGGAKPTIAALARDQDVTAAFQALKDGDAFDVCLADGLEPETIAVIRGHELVPAEAFRVPGVEGPVRFVDEIDLVRVAEVAVAATRVPDAFEAYCRRVSPVPLPHFLSALALLVGKGLLRARLAG